MKKMNNINNMITLILRAVALAMGVAAVVLTLLGGVSVENSITLLGIGLVALAIDALSRSKKMRNRQPILERNREEEKVYE
jgi:hypothetical protein